MTGARALLWSLVPVALAAGCATPEPVAPAAPKAMVSSSITAKLPAGADIFVDKVATDSAAKEGKAPYDALTGAFPLVQPQGLENYRESVRLTLQAAGARSGAERGPDAYVLRATILGGMAIPYSEAYSVLFVHYQLEDGGSGKVLWSKTIYSQAKLRDVRERSADDKSADPAYGRLAAANLRQMADALAAWFAASNPRKNNPK